MFQSVSRGLNILSGGVGFNGATVRRGHNLSEETKQKIRDSRVGFKHTEDSKKLMSLNNAMRNPQHKNKMIQAVKDSFTPELRSHLSKKQTEIKAIYNPLSKPVRQLTLEGEYIGKFKSTHDAARNIGTTAERISAVCRGARKTHRGFLWEYI